MSSPIPSSSVAHRCAHHAVWARIDFAGQLVDVTNEPFVIGRAGDLAIDADNRYLHRSLLTLSRHGSGVALSNVGSQLVVRVFDHGRRFDAHLAPGSALVLVGPVHTVVFRAGPTAYELTVESPPSQFLPCSTVHRSGPPTIDRRPALTDDQVLLLLALVEPMLRGERRSEACLPTSRQAARRLGWTVTRFNRKLDGICLKLSARGVSGLHGAPGDLATNRRARLVEFAMDVGLVDADDLPMLDRERARCD